jgi:hypothetical protein
METESVGKPDLTNVVADATKMREAAATREYTMADAIADARWVERTPDGLLDAERARQIITTLHAALQRSRCYYNAVQRGQEVFVLVQQDRAAPLAITAWANIAGNHGCPQEKVDDAIRVAIAWRGLAPETTKWPD